MEKMIDIVRFQLRDSAELKERVAHELADVVAIIAGELITCFREGGTVFLCGNGGSAADAQHLAGEMSCRLKIERDGLPAVALTTNTSVLTALANDYSYNEVFSRQVKALAHSGDCLVAISTSGTSESVNAAVRKARQVGARTIALTGRDGGKLAGLADVVLIVPSQDTQRIQEVHITIGHILCDLVERELFLPPESRGYE